MDDHLWGVPDMSDFRLGQHEQAIQILLSGQERMEATINRVEMKLATMRGERRATLWWMSTGGAVMGSLLTLVVDHIFK